MESWEQLAKCSPTKLPAIDQLASLGVDTGHLGFGIIGRVERSCSRSKPGFKVIELGVHHRTFGGIHNQPHQPLDEILHPAHLHRIEAIYEQCASEQTPHHWRCMNLARNAPAARYARTIVPIADDCGDQRCLFGIWIWAEEDMTATHMDAHQGEQDFAP